MNTIKHFKKALVFKHSITPFRQIPQSYDQERERLQLLKRALKLLSAEQHQSQVESLNDNIHEIHHKDKFVNEQHIEELENIKSHGKKLNMDIKVSKQDILQQIKEIEEKLKTADQNAPKQENKEKEGGARSKSVSPQMSMDKMTLPKEERDLKLDQHTKETEGDIEEFLSYSKEKVFEPKSSIQQQSVLQNQQKIIDPEVSNIIGSENTRLQNDETQRYQANNIFEIPLQRQIGNSQRKQQDRFLSQEPKRSAEDSHYSLYNPDILPQGMTVDSQPEYIVISNYGLFQDSKMTKIQQEQKLTKAQALAIKEPAEIRTEASKQVEQQQQFIKQDKDELISEERSNESTSLQLNSKKEVQNVESDIEETTTQAVLQEQQQINISSAHSNELLALNDTQENKLIDTLNPQQVSQKSVDIDPINITKFEEQVIQEEAKFEDQTLEGQEQSQIAYQNQEKIVNESFSEVENRKEITTEQWQTKLQDQIPSTSIQVQDVIQDEKDSSQLKLQEVKETKGFSQIDKIADHAKVSKNENLMDEQSPSNSLITSSLLDTEPYETLKNKQEGNSKGFNEALDISLLQEQPKEFSAINKEDQDNQVELKESQKDAALQFQSVEKDENYKSILTGYSEITQDLIFNISQVNQVQTSQEAQEFQKDHLDKAKENILTESIFQTTEQQKLQEPLQTLENYSAITMRETLQIQEVREKTDVSLQNEESNALAQIQDFPKALTQQEKQAITLAFFKKQKTDIALLQKEASGILEIEEQAADVISFPKGPTAISERAAAKTPMEQIKEGKDLQQRETNQIDLKYHEEESLALQTRPDEVLQVLIPDQSPKFVQEIKDYPHDLKIITQSPRQMVSQKQQPSEISIIQQEASSLQEQTKENAQIKILELEKNYVALQDQQQVSLQIPPKESTMMLSSLEKPAFLQTIKEENSALKSADSQITTQLLVQKDTLKSLDIIQPCPLILPQENVQLFDISKDAEKQSLKILNEEKSVQITQQQENQLSISNVESQLPLEIKKETSHLIIIKEEPLEILQQEVSDIAQSQYFQINPLYYLQGEDPQQQTEVEGIPKTLESFPQNVEIDQKQSALDQTLAISEQKQELSEELESIKEIEVNGPEQVQQNKETINFTAEDMTQLLHSQNSKFSITNNDQQKQLMHMILLRSFYLPLPTISTIKVPFKLSLEDIQVNLRTQTKKAQESKKDYITHVVEGQKDIAISSQAPLLEAMNSDVQHIHQIEQVFENSQQQNISIEEQSKAQAQIREQVEQSQNNQQINKDQKDKSSLLTSDRTVVQQEFEAFKEPDLLEKQSSIVKNEFRNQSKVLQCAQRLRIKVIEKNASLKYLKTKVNAIKIRYNTIFEGRKDSAIEKLENIKKSPTIASLKQGQILDLVQGQVKALEMMKNLNQSITSNKQKYIQRMQTIKEKKDNAVKALTDPQLMKDALKAKAMQIQSSLNQDKAVIIKKFQTATTTIVHCMQEFYCKLHKILTKDALQLLSQSQDKGSEVLANLKKQTLQIQTSLSEYLLKIKQALTQQHKSIMAIIGEFKGTQKKILEKQSLLLINIKNQINLYLKLINDRAKALYSPIDNSIQAIKIGLNKSKELSSQTIENAFGQANFIAQKVQQQSEIFAQFSQEQTHALKEKVGETKAKIVVYSRRQSAIINEGIKEKSSAAVEKVRKGSVSLTRSMLSLTSSVSQMTLAGLAQAKDKSQQYSQKTRHNWQKLAAKIHSASFTKSLNNRMTIIKEIKNYQILKLMKEKQISMIEMIKSKSSPWSISLTKADLSNLMKSPQMLEIFKNRQAINFQLSNFGKALQAQSEDLKLIFQYIAVFGLLAGSLVLLELTLKKTLDKDATQEWWSMPDFQDEENQYFALKESKFYLDKGFYSYFDDNDRRIKNTVY